MIVCPVAHAIRVGLAAGMACLLLGAVFAPPARADCVRSCGAELAACKRTRCAGTRGPDRRRCLVDCRGATGCGGGIGTLAYVVTTCRAHQGMLEGEQELRIRRGGCDPVTVARFANPEPVADPFGLCSAVSQNRAGMLSPIAGVFQRLGVSDDGSAVVFEVSNAFELIERTPLSADQQGFFYVRSDGTGLRRLGSPSRDPVYRIWATDLPSPIPGVSAGTHTELPIALDRRKVAFTDIGPGMDGVQREQIFTLDLDSGDRRQLTRFDPFPPPAPFQLEHHLLLWLSFASRRSLTFTSHADTWKLWQVNLDGTNLRDVSVDPTWIDAAAGGPVVRRLRLTGSRLRIRVIETQHPTEHATVHEVFRLIEDGRIQLTDFRRKDTAVLGVRGDDVLVMGSGDPLGTNPTETCQIFRVSPRGTGLRQLTDFGNGARAEHGCFLDALPGCAITFVPQTGNSRSLLFYSDCDPFGTNPDGSQVFAIDYDGSRLRQLTHMAGVLREPDGAVAVEIPGPVASGGR